MIHFSDLPTVDACLNTTCGCLLTLGLIFIRRGNRNAHRACMLAAFVTSIAFLACYLTYHAYEGHTVFRHPAWFRPIYLVILITHSVLATVVVPMALVTLYRAWKGNFERHKRIARWTWPVWMYVSVTGVVVYLLLYHIFPQTPGVG